MALSSRNVKIQLLATVSSLALVGAAQAADMARPAFKAPPAYVAAPNWTGFYVGGNLGAAWHKWEFNDKDDFLSDGLPENFWSGNKAAFTLGGQLGYNWQSGNFVYGLEGDFNWVDAKSSTKFFDPIANNTVTASTSMNWLATVRGRLGVAITPATLLFATGGLAVAHVHDHWTYTFSAGTFPDNSKTLAGYAVGGGVEYMFMPNWTAKLEGLYVGLPNSTTSFQSSGATYQTEFKHSSALARLGINYKF